jgi:hypothetical protein
MLIGTMLKYESLRKLGEQVLSYFDWLSPQVLSIKLKQIERAQYRAGKRAVAAN